MERFLVNNPWMQFFQATPQHKLKNWCQFGARNKITLDQLLQTITLRHKNDVSCIDELLLECFTKLKWYMQDDFGKFKQRWQRFLSIITQSSILILWIKRLSILPFIKALPQIRFTNLKILRLEYNQMANMEIVTFLDVPQLKFLSISENRLINVKSLIKCFVQNPVQLVKFSQNMILSISDRQIMRRINFNLKTNSQTPIYKLQYIKNDQLILEPISPDPIFWIPFHLKRIDVLYVKPSTMNNIKLSKMMKNIFDGVKIKEYVRNLTEMRDIKSYQFAYQNSILQQKPDQIK